MMLSVAEII